MDGETAERLVPGRREHEVAATVALLRAGVVPADRLGAAIDHVGSAVGLLELAGRGEHVPVVESQGELLPRVSPDEVERALADSAAWLAAGLDVRTVLDPDFPSRLHEIYNRPPLVFVEGTWREDRDLRANPDPPELPTRELHATAKAVVANELSR